MPPVPPRQGGGDAYPSGTPPYGVPSDPAFSRAGGPLPQGAQPGEGGPASASTSASVSASGEEPKSTETTLTTRIKINIPGSRPIPPVVVREPVNQAQNPAPAGDEPGAPSSRRHRGDAAGSPVLGVMDSGSQPSVPPDLPPEWRTPPAGQAQGQGQPQEGGGGSSWFAPRKKSDGPAPADPLAAGAPRPSRQGIDPFAGPPTDAPSARPGAGGFSPDPGFAGPGAGAPGAANGGRPGAGATNPYGIDAAAADGPSNRPGTGPFGPDPTTAFAGPGAGGPDAANSRRPGAGPFGPEGTTGFAGPGAGGPGAANGGRRGAGPLGPDATGTGFAGPGTTTPPTEPGFAGPGAGAPDAANSRRPGAGPFGPDGTGTGFAGPGAGGSGVSPYGVDAAADGTSNRPGGPGSFGSEGNGDPFLPGAEGAQAARRSAGGDAGPATRAFPAVGADLGSPGATQTHGSGINPFAPDAGAFPPPAPGGGTPFPPSTADGNGGAVYAPKPKVRGGANSRPAGMNGGLSVNTSPTPASAPAPTVETTARLRPVGDGFAGGTGGAGAPARPEPQGAQGASGGKKGGAEKPRKAPSKARKLAGYGVGAVVLVGGVAYGAGLMLNQADVPRGTTVLGTAIGGDTRDQAVHTLDGTLGKLATQPLQLSVDGRQLTLNPEVAGLTMDTGATVAQVTHHSYNPTTVLQSLLGNGNAVAPVVEIDADKLRSALSRLAPASSSAHEGSIRFSAAGKTLVTLPKAGAGLNVDAAVALVEQAYRNRAAGAKEGTITLPVTDVKPKSTAASTNQAAQTLGKWAMQSKLFHVKAGTVDVPFGPRTFSLALTLRPDDSGAFVPVFDVTALKAAYGSKFAGAKVNGSAVTAQQVADALVTLLSKPHGPTSITLK